MNLYASFFRLTELIVLKENVEMRRIPDDFLDWKQNLK
jgi:hypothetical protein